MMRRLSTPTYSIEYNNYDPSRLPSQSWRTAFIDFCPLHHRHLPNVRHNGFRAYPAVRLFDMDRLVDTLQPALSLPHTMEASSSFFLSSSTLLLSRIPSAILGTISYAVTSLTSLLLPMAGQLQRTGETLLAAFLFLSVIQAMVALYQYRYDARGQLVFPDGLTSGKENYYAGDSDNSRGIDSALGNNQVDKQCEESIVSSNVTDESPTGTTIAKINSSWATQVIKKLNKSLFLLLPWITRNVHNLLTKNTHLFHIGFIVFILDSLLPFMLDGGSESEVAAADNIKIGDEKGGKNARSIEIDPSISSRLRKMNSHSEVSNNQDPIRVLVIGDSLSIGIGCIEQFDATKDNSVPMSLIENTVASESQKSAMFPRQGPVFPQVLARTLSYHFQQPVQWRSAGVDGGDVNDIRSFCMDVVKQECTKGDATIDIVVVLFGMNDLKKLLSVNPVQHLFHSSSREMKDGGATSHFRHGMEVLLSDIRAYAPDALVVFPALPIQPFHKNSIINIFPLGLLVDAVLGVWERQKKIVASNWSNTIFLELKAKEIADWYSSNNSSNGITPSSSLAGEHDSSIIDDFDDVKDDVLLSADGVHPNKRMYAKWAELVGHKLYKQIVPQIELVEKNHGLAFKRDQGCTTEGGKANKNNQDNKLKA